MTPMAAFLLRAPTPSRGCSGGNLLAQAARVGSGMVLLEAE
ncbi:MAG: hypothetical protein RLZZ213_1166, partial [Cyanobacteriota bacterium]